MRIAREQGRPARPGGRGAHRQRGGAPAAVGGGAGPQLRAEEAARSRRFPSPLPTPAAPSPWNHLLTRTGGFDSDLVGRDRAAAEDGEPLAESPATRRPPRVRAPGETVAYDNYGYALAGRLVADVSWTDFPSCVETRILRPLGMTRSPFAQPQPARIAAHLARGHRPDGASGWTEEKGRYGAWSAAGPGAAGTAADMGRRLVDRPTAHTPANRLMQRVHHRQDPRPPGLGHGYEEWRGGGHTGWFKDGDIPGFHSAPLLLPERGPGIFVVFNGDGVDGRAGRDGREPVDRIVGALAPRPSAPPATPAPPRPTPPSPRTPAVTAPPGSAAPASWPSRGWRERSPSGGTAGTACAPPASPPPPTGPNSAGPRRAADCSVSGTAATPRSPSPAGACRSRRRRRRRRTGSCPGAGPPPCTRPCSSPARPCRPSAPSPSPRRRWRDVSASGRRTRAARAARAAATVAGLLTGAFAAALAAVVSDVNAMMEAVPLGSPPLSVVTVLGTALAATSPGVVAGAVGAWQRGWWTRTARTLFTLTAPASPTTASLLLHCHLVSAPLTRLAW
ncbi:serine hydrolase domain-containing protein [Streptomyces omiyaensis]|uniref:serine hydrolase domain-containing protein n=1 Tax=Streptomyces omiyaensis TaxID=68247 RepID=UPI001E33A1EB|nr:serine hydrolase domain-containing protein [Streptomyces omiyaensis]